MFSGERGMRPLGDKGKETVDEETFKKMLVDERPSLLKYANFLVRGEDRHKLIEPEDLTQETISLALKYRTGFQKGTDILAWLTTIQKHIFINLVKAHWHKMGIIIRGDEARREIDATTRPANQESAADLAKTLSLIYRPGYLTDSQRRAVELVAMEYTPKEGAESLGMDPSTFTTHVSRAREKLRSQMGRDDPEKKR